MKRYNVIDTLRGLTVLSMVIYHALWDVVYIAGYDIEWYVSKGGYVWQQSICWVFIFLSGFCWNMSRSNLKRGIIVFLCGVTVSVVTALVIPESRILFGILTFIGSCMIIMVPLNKLLKNINAYVGLLASVLLFLVTRNINIGYLGFEGVNLIKLPQELYANLFTTYLGFRANSFSSSDYFSLFPWIFLYIAGYYGYIAAKNSNKLEYLRGREVKVIGWIGRFSLPIYMIHQPILMLIFKIFI